MIGLIICLDGLGKHFGHTIAVDGISMVVGKGEIFGFWVRTALVKPPPSGCYAD